MTTHPLFSIIVASYNNGKYLPECLDSLLNQSYKAIEIIIVDDASTDNSVEIIRLYQKKDNRIKLYINKKNKGVGFSKQKGVKYSKGNIIGTVGSDDILLNNSVELMIGAHNNCPKASLIYSNLVFCNSHMQETNEKSVIAQIPESETYLSWNKSVSGTVSGFRTMKRCFYEKTDGFSAFFRKAVDRDIIYKMEEVGKLEFLNKYLYYYRLHTENISRNKNAWKAKLWEVRAKEKAYKRRLNTDIPNVTAQYIHNEYYYTYKMLCAESLASKKHIEYIKLVVQFSWVLKNPFSILKFIYYTLMKHYKPMKY